MLDNKFRKLLLYSLWVKPRGGFPGKVPLSSFQKIGGAAIRNKAGSVCPALDGLADLQSSL